MVIHSFTVHALLLCYPILLLSAGELRRDWRHFPRCFLLLAGFAAVAVAANAVFDTLSQTVLSYAQETVYPTAQEKQAIGYVNGGYSISEVDETLVVDYTLSVSYSTETSDQQFTHIYTIDLSTGELLKEE